MIHKLEWDSRYFGFGIAKAEVHHLGELQLIWKEIESHSNDFQCIYLFSDIELPENLIRSSSGKLAVFVDNKRGFCKELSLVTKLHSGIRVYDHSIPNEALIELAIESGKFSRFYTDLGFRPHFRRLYTDWMLNSLNGEFADRVFVLYENEQIAGMVSCSIKSGIGQIGLIAASPGFQGKGIGSRLIAATENYYLENGIHFSRIVTQNQNQAACAFYLKNNYLPESSVFVYHIWNIHER